MGRTLGGALRRSAVALIVALTAGVLVPAAAGSAPVCAAEAAGVPHAALVVGTGSATTTYCVALDSASVSGIRLIQLAGRQFGLQYRLGFGGQAVCQLAGIGPTSGDCFGDYPDFWGYWHGDGRGGWRWASTGAGSATIRAGDVQGWTWGSGDSGTTHEAPPALRFRDVCEERKPSPTPTPPPGGGGGGGGGGSGGGGSGGGGGNGPDDPPATGEGPNGDGGEGSGDGDRPRNGNGNGNGGDRAREDEGPSPGATDPPLVAASPVTALAAGETPASGGGGPAIGAFLALAGVALLGAGGWFLQRRRASGGG